MPTRVKICGITRRDDALHACRAGADALGFVFYESSPRAIDVEAAAGIVRSLPPFVTSVALFVDPAQDLVARVLNVVRPDLLQFHGDETPAFCERFGAPYLKAVRVRPGVDLLEYARRYASARGLLLDAYVGGVPGGTGRRFDWSLIPADLGLPVVLSGGLDPDNVARAIGQVRPWAVDVSSGVERAKGIKDPQRVREFISGVRNAGA